MAVLFFFLRVYFVYFSAGKPPGLCPMGCEAEKILSTHDIKFSHIMISKLGMDSLPVGRGEVRPVELPSVDDRPQVPKEHDSDMREAGKLQGSDADDRTRHAETGHLSVR